MSDEKTKLSGPDLANGVALSTVAEGAMLLGHRAWVIGAPRSAGKRVVRNRKHLHTLWRSAERRAACGRYRPLSVASRLFQSASRWGSARAGVRSRLAMARRTA